MPWQSALFQPGVDTEKTPTLNAQGWSQSNLIRFREGLPEKNGGWAALTTTPLVGTARQLHSWADLEGIPYLAAGTEQRLEVFSGGMITDITPYRAVDNVAVSVSTIGGQATVKIHDPSNGTVAGDWVDIVIPISVGGLILQGFYQVTPLDADNYDITAAMVASTTVTNGGAVPSFTSVMGSPNLTVTLANHGQVVNGLFQVQVATTVGGIAMGAFTSYEITSVQTANTFVIAPAGNASSSATVHENSSNAQYAYLIPTGFVSNTPLSGYGIGPFGEGPYGGSSSSFIAPLRQWFLDNWGEDLIGNYNGSPIYVWIPPVAPGNVAIPIDTTDFPGAVDPPTAVNVSFVAMPEQILIALGVDPVGGGDLDPLLVRWCDVSDFTDWDATATNQAGSFRIPSGSRLVGGLQGPVAGMIWTDVDMWIVSYIGFPLVWSFNKIAGGVGLIAARACCVAKDIVYWVSSNNIWAYNGGEPTIVPCTVWDQLFRNINRQQIDKLYMGVNSWFNEIAVFYPSATGTGEVDSYIRLNYLDNLWDYGSLVRTAWVDAGAFGAPIGADQNDILQQHEIATDNDGAVMGEFVQSGFFSISDGEFFTFMERIIADFVFAGVNPQVQYWVIVQDYTTNPEITYGPFTAMPTASDYSIIRARGRLASLKIGGSGVGSFWRLGNVRYLLARSGSR